MTNKIFETEYKKLNKEQKKAVDNIDGPVMVVAGPGTGKTQILALRICNIIKKAGAEANEILALTFTNSGAKAMRNRLEEYIGEESRQVNISTFHSFALELIENYHNLLDFRTLPSLLKDDEAVFLIDEILNNQEWKYLRPRTNPELYFNDLKHLISIMKRERLTPPEFQKAIDEEVIKLKNDPESISSMGESKGKIKKEIEKKIESLERTMEVVEFYQIYERFKKERSLMDYDDTLEYVVYLSEQYEDVRAELREKYQYVLVDEHQDSSGVQNAFLRAVWQKVEKPNIFVVGDDRQLIYAFSGASLSYFEEFLHIFGKAKLITLSENYRSTEKILSLAQNLLESEMSKDKLKSNTMSGELILLNEYTYPRDEIIGAGLYLKQKIAEGIKIENCAVLVPRNYQVRNAINTLSNLGLPVSTGKEVSIFEIPETESFLRILRIIADPYNPIYLAESIINPMSLVEPMQAYKFLKNVKTDKLTIEDFKRASSSEGLFAGENIISKWGILLENWVNTLSQQHIVNIVSEIGEYFIHNSKEHETLIRNVELIRTLIHLAEMFSLKKPNATIVDFIAYIDRLRSYGSHISLATFGKTSGVQVMTLHKSKGLEWEAVWIAHMNEEILMSEKKNGFTLPESIKEHIKERNTEMAKRELYVAITRAKSFCALSYAFENYTGLEMNLAEIINELNQKHFVKKDKEETEREILSMGPDIYIRKEKRGSEDMLKELKKFVEENYLDTKISVTMLNNFFECPWKWYFRNFLRLPEVKGSSLALGSAVHECIEFILKEPALPNEKTIKIKIINELEKILNDSREINRLSKDAFSAITTFVKEFYPKIEKDYKSERSIQFRDSAWKHLLLYGKIDLTEYSPNGSISVTDFKTGNTKTKNIIEKRDEEGRLSSYLRQLAMYSYLISGAEKKEVLSSKLFFLEAESKDKNKFYETHINKEEIDLLKKDIEDYDSLLKTGDWTERPCHYNSYGKNTECEYCKIAEIYK